MGGPDLWYLVGLITADGCLSRNGRHVDVTSKDYDFLSEIKKKTGLENRIGIKNKGKINEAYHIQISNKNFYEFLLSIGLTPAKSFIQKAVYVPDGCFVDFCRGVIDGDGSIRRWLHSGNGREQWSLRIYSSSRPFVEWMQAEIQRRFLAKGCIHCTKGMASRRDHYTLKFGKNAARDILRRCYYENSLALERKARLAQRLVVARMGRTKSGSILN